ncbi:CD177 antigen-like isoform X2 [Dromiciops gliroides]|uniref:CD177 antigen-like isoform X2 n=1 Tax=Dromiciops gliroides TaxID=33562 RepID=UPI001CC58080|nr:CD177 antigen-like isoform X2 [Dromiciops gliroides]
MMEDHPVNPIFPLFPPITCYHTEMLYFGRKLNSEPELWSSSLQHSKRCENWEVCQETLLMLETGPHSLIVGSKGCTPAGNRISGVTEHLGPPGIIMTSYVRFCNVNYCNNASSTAPVLRPRAHKVIRDSDHTLRCPTCLALYSCPTKVRLRRCSEKALRCYNGTIHIKGEGTSYDLGLLGCSTVPTCDLFLGIEAIGPFTLSEKCLDHHNVLWPRSQGAPWPAWVWTLGLGLLLTL